MLDAAAAWVWVPDGAIEVCTDDYQLIRYPDRVLDAGFPAAQVVSLRTARPIDEVIAEVTGQVRGWELPSVDWWITESTRPAETEAALLALVKARPDTSAPILLRSGFTDFGQQRRYWLTAG